MNFISGAGERAFDVYGRPRLFAEQLVHHDCTRNEFCEFKASAERPSHDGAHMGCMATLAHADCNMPLWNGEGSCTRAGFACSAKPVEAAERLRMLTILHEFRAFLERQLFGDRLEAVTELASEATLDAWARDPMRRRADFPFFLRIAADCELARLGRASDVFLSYGAYHGDDGPLFAAGVWVGGTRDRRGVG